MEHAQEGAQGGALGMKTGEHKDILTAKGSKFYTVGRARFKPHRGAKELQRIEYLKILPLPLYIVNDAFNLEETFSPQEIANRWRTAVECNLLAHSDMTLFNGIDTIHDVYTFDVKLMAQKKVVDRQNKDINSDISRADAIEKLRIIRTRLTYALPECVLKRLFIGWKNVNPNLYINVNDDMVVGNPFMDPFSDMSIDDFAQPEGVQIVSNLRDDGCFIFFGDEGSVPEGVTGIDFDFVLQGGSHGGSYGGPGSTMDSEWFLRLSSFGMPYSKFFGYPKLEEYIDKYKLYASLDAFAFVNDGLIVAYGWSSTKKGMSLLRVVARELGTQSLLALVPTIAPAFAHGQQQCIREAYIDLDILKPFVKYFDAKILYDVPDLDTVFLDMTKKKIRSKYSMMYTAARAGTRKVVHELCEETQTPHEFVVELRFESE